MITIAIISGIVGQLGSTLGEFLLDKGYFVVGTTRRSANPDLSNIDLIKNNPNFKLESMDLADSGSINRVIAEYKPQEFYNLGAMSLVSESWKTPISTFDINCTGVVRCLEAIRLFSPKTKFYQCSTSECIGASEEILQNENTILKPQSPYSAAKLGAEAAVRVYNQSYGLFACFSRNFNFEGPRRSKQFVTRKITSTIGEMVAIADYNDLSIQDSLDKGLINKIGLGFLLAKRDWSFCGDIANGIWSMMQLDQPDTFVFGSGVTRSIKDLLKEAFSIVDVENWEDFIETDPDMFRPAEVNYLCCDATKAKTILGWQPKVSFEQMIRMMVYNDISLAKNKIGSKVNEALIL